MSEPLSIRAIVADDSYLVRAGIREVLQSRQVDVVGEAVDQASLLAIVDRERPDAVIVDIRMPPTQTDEGIVAARDIAQLYPEVAIVVLSMVVDAAMASRLLEDHPEGVGYLLKDRVTDADGLVEAIKRVQAGECVLDPVVVTQLLGRSPNNDALCALTQRERDVLELMAEGRDNAGIASQLVLSERTVESHVTSVFDKLGLAAKRGVNRRVLAVLAFLSR